VAFQREYEASIIELNPTLLLEDFYSFKMWVRKELSHTVITFFLNGCLFVSFDQHDQPIDTLKMFMIFAFQSSVSILLNM